jgi:TP901 family phage tail tape measure protein
MAGKNTVEIKILGRSSGFRRSLKESENDLSKFARRGAQALNPLQTAGKNLGRAITNPFIGLAGGVAIVAAARNIMNFDKSLTRLAINGRLTKKEQFELREEIGKLGTEFGKSREDVLGGLDAIVKRTGDIGFARDVMKDLALASTASGASMEDLGALSSNLQQKLEIGPKGLAEALNILNVQGKEGAFTLEELAALGERLFAASGRLGMKGAGDLRKYGALIQTARMGTGSSEQATTAIERILDAIIEKQDLISKKAKFDVFSNKALKQYKSIDQIIKGIIAGTGGDEKILGDIFGAEGVRGVAELSRRYRETNGFDFFDKLTNSDAGRATETLNDAGRAMDSASFVFDKLRSIIERASDGVLSKTISNLAESLQELTKNPQEAEDLIESLTLIGGAIGTLVKWLGKGVKLWGDFWEGAANRMYGVTDDDMKYLAGQNSFNELTAKKRKGAIGKVNSGGKHRLFDETDNLAHGTAAGKGQKAEQVVNITVSDTMQVRASATSNGSTSAVRVSKKDNSFLVK